MKTLRPYQSAAVTAVMTAYDMEYRRVMYTLPTGCGKSLCFAELTKLFLLNGWKVLILAHRRELITQAFKTVKEHCGLEEWEIGTEIASISAPKQARVVIGSLMTVRGAARLPDFQADVIIADECHRSGGLTFKRICERYGVYKGECFYVGCTATAKRQDKQSLYAIKPDGKRVEIVADKKTQKRIPADASNCIFEKLVYEYPMVDAIEDGWLVPIIGHSVKTETDISGVATGTDGDFQDGQLEEAVNNAQRTLVAISAWKQVAEDRPTLVFCAGVKHAHDSAELWRQAGYTAESIDGTTDTWTREKNLQAFKDGRLQILTNCAVFTEGTDLPNCACVVQLRPTKSWNMYVQQSGRGTRPLPGIVDGEPDAPARREAIALSLKADCIILDLVDISKNQDLCAAPSLLDLPANMDLQGQSVSAAKKLLDEFDEIKEQVIGECPLTYQALETRLMQVELIRNSAAKTAQTWAATEQGFRFRHTRPGYQVELASVAPGQFELEVKHGKDTLLKKVGRQIGSVDPNGKEIDFKSYLDISASRAADVIERHVEANMPSRGTLMRLTPKQQNVLRRAGHNMQEVDCWPYAKAKAVIDKIFDDLREKGLY